jgi:hypothetical protein
MVEYDECGLFDQLFVGWMVTNPKPSSRAGLEYTQGPESQRDSERPNVSRRFNTLKSEGGIERIFFPNFEGFSSRLAGGVRQSSIGLPK